MTDTSATLLEQARAGDPIAWRRMVELYRPLIFGWFRRHDVHEHEAEDLTQEVLVVVVREIGSFQHRGFPGCFRSWLRGITVFRARGYWRSRLTHAQAAGGHRFALMLDQLEDDHSELTQQWDAEHDAHIVRELFATIEAEFEPTTLAIFRRLVMDQAPPSEVASEFRMNLAAVYAAKSRVLQKLRQSAYGLID